MGKYIRDLPMGDVSTHTAPTLVGAGWGSARRFDNPTSTKEQELLDQVVNQQIQQEIALETQALDMSVPDIVSPEELPSWVLPVAAGVGALLLIGLVVKLKK